MISSLELGLHRLGHGLATLSGRKKDALCMLVLLSLSIIFFANVLFTDKVLVCDNLMRYRPWRHYATEQLSQAPTNLLFDRVLAHYPQMLTAARVVRSGNLPLWNPHYLSGTPFLATEPWGAFFYPFTVIFYVLDPLEAFGYVSFIHLFLAGTFMYFYLRSIELDRMSSLFGALAFEFGGFLLANLAWGARVGTATWIPLIFLCFEEWYRGRRWLHLFLLVFAIAACFLAGHQMIFVYVIVSLGLYCLSKLFVAPKDQWIREGSKSIIALLAAVTVAMVLSAVQFIPSYEALQFYERIQKPYEVRFEGGHSPVSLATVLVPDIFGNPVDRSRPDWSTNEFGARVPGNYAAPNIYTGLLPLILAMWALALRRDRYVLFFLVLALLSISIVIDFPSFVWRLLYHLPVFRIGRQVEAKVMYMFAVPVLASLGFDSLLQTTTPENSERIKKAGRILLLVGGTVIVGVAIGMTALNLVGRSAEVDSVWEWCFYNIPNLFRFSLLLAVCSVPLLLRARGRLCLFYLSATVILLLDMFYFGWRFNPPQNPEYLYFETEGIRFLQSDQDMFRIIRGPRGRNSLPSNTPEVYGISDAQGYTSFRIDYYAEFMNLIEDGICEEWQIHPLREPGSFSSKLLDLLNVKYILTGPAADGELAALDEADDNIEIVYEGDLKIYQNKNVLPRAFVVAKYKVLPDKEDMFTELTSEEFDPAAYVILEQEPELHFTSAGSSAGESSATIVEYTPNRVTVEAEMSSDGFLVLSDLYYRGWRAFVDGQEQRVYKADHIFRAVRLTEGRQIVEFVFDPVSFKVGLSISVLALLVMSPLSVYAMVTRK